jgi:RNA polymerase sigma factor (sigma-70 family)
MYSNTAEQRNRERVQVLAEDLYRERYHYLLRIANRNAANREDAAEAVQFAFLAFIDKFDLASGAPPLAWTTTVVKRECWAKRKREHLDRRAGQEAERGEEGAGFSIADLPAQAAGVEERIERAEYVLEARERLASLKPAERQALGLFAAGCSYYEIGQMNDWTFTKVDRLLKEGRATLRRIAAG